MKEGKEKETTYERNEKATGKQRKRARTQKGNRRKSKKRKLKKKRGINKNKWWDSLLYLRRGTSKKKKYSTHAPSIFCI